MVGILNTLITYIIFNVLHYAFGLSFFWAETIGYSAGLINSFVLNKIWTFGQSRHFRFTETLKFMIVSLAAWGGTIIILGIFGQEGLYLPTAVAKQLHRDSLIIHGLGLPFWFAKAIAYLYSVPLNYFGFKLWVFPEKKNKPETRDGQEKE
ncbi:MAG: GtrA family protein [Spirochaetales bacterium]|nr:GtrA family protein [Spirochaetales bacterium]